MRISDWSSDVCSSDLSGAPDPAEPGLRRQLWQCNCVQRGAGADPGALSRTHTGTVGWQLVSDAGWLPYLQCAAIAGAVRCAWQGSRSEEHTSELQSLMRISYAVFCLKKKKNNKTTND